MGGIERRGGGTDPVRSGRGRRRGGPLRRQRRRRARGDARAARRDRRDAPRCGARRPHDRIGRPGAGAGGGVSRARRSASSTRRCPAARREPRTVNSRSCAAATTPTCSRRPKPVIDTYAKSCVCLGPAGSGQLTKMVNQICIAGLVQGLAEGVNFAQRAGLDVDEVIDVIGKGAAQSWQMDNRARTMAASSFDFGFAVEWMRKDLGICLEEAERNGARLPRRCARRPVLQAGRRPRRRPLGHQQPRRPPPTPLNRSGSGTERFRSSSGGARRQPETPGA